MRVKSAPARKRKYSEGCRGSCGNNTIIDLGGIEVKKKMRWQNGKHIETEIHDEGQERQNGP